MNSIDSVSSREVEVVDLGSTTTWCDELMPYPFVTRGTHGGLMPNSTPIVCGGQNSNRCFAYDMSEWNPNPGWVETFPMSTPRMHFVGMSGSPYKNSSHKYFVIGNSTISWWGAWLNKRTDKIVVAPQCWVLSDFDTSDLIPVSWNLVE